jgi:thiamine pyrophosphokinase
LSATLFRSQHPVTLIGAGPVSPGALAAALAIAPEAVAADGGADMALPAGHVLRMVIGDMDSVRDPEGLRARGVPLHRIAEQDSTDLEKCLRAVAAPLFVGLGFLGGRLDHELAAVNAVVRYPDPPVILLGAADLCFRCPETLAIDLPVGTRLSLFPMAPLTGTVSEGLRWSVKGLDMAPEARIGTSNVTTGERVRLGFEPARMLVILPAEHLPQVAAALRGPGVADGPRPPLPAR